MASFLLEGLEAKSFLFGMSNKLYKQKVNVVESGKESRAKSEGRA